MNILVEIPKNRIFNSFFQKKQIEKIHRLGTVYWNDTDRHYTKQEFKEKLQGMDICISGWGTPEFDEEQLELADDLKLVAHNAGTIRPMIGEEVYKRGIRVCSGNRIFARSVAEGVLAYALSALRRIPEYQTELRKGNWPGLEGTRGLYGKRVGLIGYGMIGEIVANMFQTFGCTVLVASKHMRSEELQEKEIQSSSITEVFESCDIISIHLSLTEETRESIGYELLHKMKKQAVLINTARGEIVDEVALSFLLEKRPDLQAVLDVFQTEPLPMDSPLRKLNNAFLMPHAAGPTEDQRLYVTDFILDDIERFQCGNPLKGEISRWRAKTMTTKF